MVGHATVFAYWTQKVGVRLPALPIDSAANVVSAETLSAFKRKLYNLD